jgi:hypothetical protein
MTAISREPSPAESPLPADLPAPESLASRLGRGIVLLGVFAIVLEATCRVEDWVAYGTPLLSPFTAQEQLVIRDADGMHGRPSSRFQKWVMNDLGLRGPPQPLAKAPGTVRVVTAGASETYGLYESVGREYPRQLEDSLAARRRAGLARCEAGNRVEVLNSGFPGMSMPTVTQDLQNRIRRYAPDVVVYYPSPSQYLGDERPFRARPDSSGLGPVNPLSRRFSPRVANRLRDQIKGLLPTPLREWLRAEDARRARDAHPPGWVFEAPPPDRLALFERDLRALVGAVHQIGAVPVLAAHANAFLRPDAAKGLSLVGWERLTPRATGATLLAFDSAAAAATARVAADSNVGLLDSRALFQQTPGVVFADHVHFTDRGAGVLAGAIARTVDRALGCGAP